MPSIRISPQSSGKADKIIRGILGKLPNFRKLFSLETPCAILRTVPWVLAAFLRKGEKVLFADGFACARKGGGLIHKPNIKEE